MKNLLALALLFCGVAKGQLILPVTPTTTGLHTQRLKPDSSLFLPENEGLKRNATDTQALIFYNKLDSGVWYWSRAVGYKRVGTGTTSGGGGGISTSIYQLENNSDSSGFYLIVDGTTRDSAFLPIQYIFGAGGQKIVDTNTVYGRGKVFYSGRLDTTYNSADGKKRIFNFMSGAKDSVWYYEKTISGKWEIVRLWNGVLDSTEYELSTGGGGSGGGGVGDTAGMMRSVIPFGVVGAIPYSRSSDGKFLYNNGGLNFNGTDLEVGNNNPGVYSGFSINGGRATLQAALNGMRFNVGSGFVTGTYDATKAYSFQNRGNPYLTLYTNGPALGPWTHHALFNTNVRITDTLRIQRPIIMETNSNASVSLFQTRWADGNPGGAYPWFAVTGNSVQSQITMGANNDGSASDIIRITAGYLPEFWTGTYRPLTIKTHDFLAFEACYGTSLVTDPIRFSNNSGRIANFTNTGELNLLKGLTVGALSNPAVSSIFDVKSTTNGSRPMPPMTKAERDLIPTPPQGLMVFVTDNGGYMSWYNGGWFKVSSVAD